MLVLCGCGAAPWPDATLTRWSATGPARAEVEVDGVGLLFDIDPEATGGTICAEWATRLGLTFVGSPSRGIRRVRAKLPLGEVVLEVVDDDRGTVHGRTVVGVLQAKVLADAGLERFGAHGCGPRLANCVAGRVTAVAEGEVTMEFERPERSLPPRMWARIDIGLPGRPRTMLVHLRPDAYRDFKLRIEGEDLGPETVRAPPGPIEVMDIVPLGMPCLGQVCQVR